MGTTFMNGYIRKEILRRINRIVIYKIYVCNMKNIENVVILE